MKPCGAEGFSPQEKWFHCTLTLHQLLFDLDLAFVANFSFKSNTGCCLRATRGLLGCSPQRQSLSVVLPIYISSTGRSQQRYSRFTEQRSIQCWPTPVCPTIVGHCFIKQG